MNFPILDHPRLHWLFPGRARARQVVAQFKNELKSSLAHQKPLSDGLGARMLRAWETGLWDEKQLLDNLTVTFVAGQENPQLLMTSTLYVLAKHPVSRPPVRGPEPEHEALSPIPRNPRGRAA